MITGTTISRVRFSIIKKQNTFYSFLFTKIWSYTSAFLPLSVMHNVFFHSTEQSFHKVSTTMVFENLPLCGMTRISSWDVHQDTELLFIRSSNKENPKNHPETHNPFFFFFIVLISFFLLSLAFILNWSTNVSSLAVFGDWG